MALVYASVASAAAPETPPKPDLDRGKQIATTVCAAWSIGYAAGHRPANLAGQNSDYIALQLAAFKSATRQPDHAGHGGGPRRKKHAQRRRLFRNAEARRVGGARQRSRCAGSRSGVAASRAWRARLRGLPWRGEPRIPAPFPRLAGQYAELSVGWLKATRPGAPHQAEPDRLAAFRERQEPSPDTSRLR
jgi:hypothetical protein